jgi:hypothetical protein
MNSSNHSVLILFELCLFFNKELKGTIVFYRLELAYKDAVKKVSLYDSAIVLLMGPLYALKKVSTARTTCPTHLVPPTLVGKTFLSPSASKVKENYPYLIFGRFCMKPVFVYYSYVWN